jgi:hypothetical protein
MRRGRQKDLASFAVAALPVTCMAESREPSSTYLASFAVAALPVTDKAPPLERPDVAGLQEGGVARERHRADAGVSDRPHGVLQRASITEYTEYSIKAMRSARQGRNNDGR